MTYVDGFVVAVPTANKQKYIDHAEGALDLFKEFGAVRMVEGWGDDVPRGEVNDLYGAVQAKDDEAVLFSVALSGYSTQLKRTTKPCFSAGSNILTRRRATPRARR